MREHSSNMNMQLYLRFLLLKKKFLLVNFIAVALAAGVYSFCIAKMEYLAETTFLPPSSSEISSPAALLGFNIPTLSTSNILPEQILTIFDSKALKRKVIERFDLYSKYKLTKEKNKFLLATKSLTRSLTMNQNQTSGMGFQQSTISFSMQAFSTSPDTARMMVDYTFGLIDSAIRCISIDRASRNRIFIESQLEKSKIKLDSLEKSLEKFQQENKAYVIPEQLKLALNSYATIKADALLTEIQLQALQRERKESSPEISTLQRNLAIINQKLKSMETSETPDVLPGFNLSTKLIPVFLNFKRDLEAQEQLILLLTKELEQAKIQEAKNVSSLIIVDPSFTPEYKIRPKRIMLMAIIILFENLFIFLVLSYQFTFNHLLQHHQGFASLVKEIWPKRISRQS
jgi:tyrosine-protein kinase Etk/Wzc